MAISKEKPFVFTWRIENFSFCPQLCNDCVESAIFTTDVPRKNKWKLRLFPRGISGENTLVCYLKRESGESQEENIYFMFTVVSAHDGKDFKSIDVNSMVYNGKYYSCSLPRREAIFYPANGFVIDDILTIKCHLWGFTTMAQNADTSIPGIAVTHIRTRSTTLLWPIKRFCRLRSGERVSNRMDSTTKDEPSFETTFYLGEESADGQSMHVEVRQINPSVKNVFVRGKMKILGSPNSSRHKGNGEYFFEGKGGEVWLFPTFVKTDDLMDDNYFYYTVDTLHLYCDFCCALPDQEYVFMKLPTDRSICYTKDRSGFNCPRTDYQRLYESGHRSDVILRAGSKIFKVHTSILAARSFVFNAMFETDMREKEMGVVDIVDIDADIVDRLLTFMYTDVVKDLSAEEAIELYRAADKYDVVPLKCRCSSALMSMLSASTVCETLILADVCRDADLLDAVRGYIHVNAREVLNSQDWKDLAKSHPAPAADVMLRILTKKFLSEEEKVEETVEEKESGGKALVELDKENKKLEVAEK